MAGSVEDASQRNGRIAYEAYCEATDWKSAISGAVLPPFAETPELVQSAWRAAAQAIKERYVD